MLDLQGLDMQQDRPSYEELSVLSLDAAIELDQLQRGEPSDTEVIRSLVYKLGLNPLVGSVDALSRLVDPKTVDIYNRTISRLADNPLNTLDQLAERVRSYSEVFARDIGSADRADVEAMRDFCLALHRELLSDNYNKTAETMADE